MHQSECSSAAKEKLNDTNEACKGDLPLSEVPSDESPFEQNDIDRSSSFTNSIKKILPWRKKRRLEDTSSNADGVYIGGKMESETAVAVIPHGGPALVEKIKRVGSQWTTSSQLSKDGEESINGFNEWTPPDSSYGAAIPVGGWIPKATRRLIEATIMIVLLLAFVYLVVTVAMRLNEEATRHQDNGSSTSGGGIYVDDDFYVPYNKKSNDDDLYNANKGAYADDFFRQYGNDDDRYIGENGEN